MGFKSVHRQRGHATSSFFKCRGDFPNLCTLEVADEVDEALPPALPHATLQSR